MPRPDWPTAAPFVPPQPDLAALAAAGQALATLRPSAVLRSDDRDTALAGLVSDLQVVAAALGARAA